MAAAGRSTSRSARDGMLEPLAVDWVGEYNGHTAAVVSDAKARARADLDKDEWMRQGWAFASAACDEPKPTGHIAREHAATLDVPTFVEKYEKPNLPVLIAGCADEWKAVKKAAWHPKKLFETYRHRRFKCGEDDEGYPVKMKLKYFLRYMAKQRDDSPLYIFDSMYEDDRSSCDILYDYQVPKYFTDDLFKIVGEHRRPPYRWFLVGPKRSGTMVHLDPLATSAWNTLIYGRKRWVLFPPTWTREEVKGRAFVHKDRGEDDEAIDYFNNILPRIRSAAGKQRAADIIEVVQYPGETIFVPGGWWHAVMNLDDTIAVTQNFCSRVNFERVWPATRDGRHGMGRKFFRLLKKVYPDLYKQARALNKAAGWDIDAERAKHAQHVAARKAARAAKAAAKAAKEAVKATRLAAKSSAGGGAAAASAASSSDSSSSNSSSDSSMSSGSETSDSDAEKRKKPAAPKRARMAADSDSDV